MKIVKFSIYVIISSTTVISQTYKPTFETGIRIQKTDFIPFEYSRTTTDSQGNSNIYPIRGNTKTINPIFIIYKNLDKGFGLEFEYSTIKIERPYYYATYYGSTNLYSKQYLRNIERSDFRANFLFYPLPKLAEIFSLGVGLRRIDKIRNADIDSYQAEEKISALGPQLIFRSKIPITESVSLNLGLDFYHSQGKRNFSHADSLLSQARSGQYSIFTYIDDNGRTKGVYQGYEAKIEVKYNFLENYNLALGYNYNYSYFKYEDLNDTLYYFSSQSNYVYYNNIKFSNGKEIIKGFYFAGSTVF